MEAFFYKLHQIYGMTGIQGSIWEAEDCLFAVGEGEEGILSCDKEFREKMMKQAEEQEIPLILTEQGKICFLVLKKESLFCIIGPSVLSSLSVLELHQFYRIHGMKMEWERPVPVFGMSKLLSMYKLIIFEFLGNTYEEQILMEENRLDSVLKDLEEDRIRFQISKEEEDKYHHTYFEEKELLSCVREGRTDDALHMNLQMDDELGKMSKNELMQWRKIVIVAITLCTRAAIEGGLSPGQAYVISDYYNQMSDDCKDISSLIVCRNKAVKRFCEEVHKRQNHPHYSSYVERCRDYVEKHYREKILLEDIAGNMGISQSYLSRLFSQEMGIRLQDYIIQFRVERAANLLTYSEESIAKIGEYVNFPSQSYFGKMFRKYKHMTPKEYREKYKPKEFI